MSLKQKKVSSRKTYPTVSVLQRRKMRMEACPLYTSTEAISDSRPEKAVSMAQWGRNHTAVLEVSGRRGSVAVQKKTEIGR